MRLRRDPVRVGRAHRLNVVVYGLKQFRRVGGNELRAWSSQSRCAWAADNRHPNILPDLNRQITSDTRPQF
jgi:hypothetical protein